MKFKMLAAAAAMLCAIASQAATVGFVINYVDAPGVGFNDATYGADRKAVLEAAVNFWSDKLVAGYAGETISLNAGSDPASTSSSPGSANASLAYYTIQTAPGVYTQYDAAMAQHKIGQNLTTATGAPNSNGTGADARLIYNFTAGMTAQTYLGQDGNPPADQFDMLTYSKRYVAHILGFESRITTGTVNQGSFLSGIPSAYDRLVAERQGDGSFLYLTAMNDSQRVAALTGSNLYWMWSNATAANGGQYLKLNSLPFKADGTIDANAEIWADPSAGTLMSYGPLKGTSRTADAITFGQLQDLGWTIAAVPEPSTYAMLLAGLGLCGFVARRRTA